MEEINVSIIIAVYNAEKYASQMFESLKRQTFKNFEIIVVNDGSTDNSIKIIEEYKKSFKYYTIINQNNQGSYLARMNGIKLIKGKYTIILDCDDKIEDTFIEKLYQSCIDNNSEIAICGFDRIEFDTNIVFSKEMCNHKQKVIDIKKTPELLVEINTSLWNKIIKSDILKNIYEFKSIPKALDDMTFLTLIYEKTNRISFIDLTLYHYYVHKNSVITSITEEKIKDVEETLKEIKQQYCINNVAEDLKEVLSIMVFLHLCISMLYRMYYSCDKTTFSKIKNRIDLFIDENFPEYKNTKFLKFKYVITHERCNLKVFIMKKIYKFHMFTIFLKFYYFLIKTFKFDIKW